MTRPCPFSSRKTTSGNCPALPVCPDIPVWLFPVPPAWEQSYIFHTIHAAPKNPVSSPISSVSKEKIARLKKEAADFPARKDSLAGEIQTEQEAVRFRRERLDKVLAEEGFDSLSDYLQEAQILSQMELEAETLEQEITSCREQTEELERRYGELEEKLDAEDLKGFEPWREKWSGHYEKKAAEHIRKRKGGFRMYLFERAVQNTGYSLRHGAYLAGRTAYVVKEMVQAAEETDGQGRKR